MWPLIERPLFVKVRIVKPRTIATAAGDTEDGPVLYLKPRVVEWARGATKKAKVKRIGFPLVPEFGGAVHAYCGTTLDASQSDLLEWYKRPSREDMQKAYINESRVGTVDQLLIVQPHSPELFREGDLPGPVLLMDMLQGRKTTAEAKDAWEELERATGTHR